MPSEFIIIVMAVMLGSMKKLGITTRAETSPEKRGQSDARRSRQVAALVLRTKPTLDLSCSVAPEPCG